MIKPEMIPDEVVEAAARAAWRLKDQSLWEVMKATQPKWQEEARAAIAVLRPVIRAEALEEAAKVCDPKGNCSEMDAYGREFAAAIRALKEPI